MKDEHHRDLMAHLQAKLYEAQHKTQEEAGDGTDGIPASFLEKMTEINKELEKYKEQSGGLGTSQHEDSA